MDFIFLLLPPLPFPLPDCAPAILGTLPLCCVYQFLGGGVVVLLMVVPCFFPGCFCEQVMLPIVSCVVVLVGVCFLPLLCWLFCVLLFRTRLCPPNPP